MVERVWDIGENLGSPAYSRIFHTSHSPCNDSFQPGHSYLTTVTDAIIVASANPSHPDGRRSLMNRITQALVLLVVVSSTAYAGGTPVNVTPEPATIGLVLTGLGAIGVGAWWKRRR